MGELIMVEKTKDHVYELDFDYDDFNNAVEEIVHEFKHSNYKNIYGVPRGGLILATVLSHKLGLPMTDKIGDETIIVDDICDTGKTLINFRNLKIVLVAKDLGRHRVDNNLFYFLGVDDNIWVNFWWEEK